MINLISKRISLLFVLSFLASIVAFSVNASASTTSSDDTIIKLAETSSPTSPPTSSPPTSTPTPNPTGITINTKTANENAFVTTLCNVFRIATGSGGKAFAAFAIISLGIGFFTGKVSWGLMLGVAAGIAAMFGAPTIVAAIAGGEAFNCDK